MGCASSSKSAGVSSPSPTLLTSGQNGVKSRSTLAAAKAQSPGTPGDVQLLTGADKHLLRTVLETSIFMFDGSKERAGEFVSQVHAHAFGIIKEGSGLGPSGECPFASAYEVDIFYKFCVKVCAAWSKHKLGEDDQLDQYFFFQMEDLCAILCFLDTKVVPLPEEIEQNIKIIQRGVLFPHWVEAQLPKGVTALECCVTVGRKWGLQDTDAFRKATAALRNEVLD